MSERYTIDESCLSITDNTNNYDCYHLTTGANATPEPPANHLHQSLLPDPCPAAVRKRSYPTPVTPVAVIVAVTIP